jgi:hypothetical protein
MNQAVIAISSLLIGVALNEYVRRSNRIEGYAAAIFQKRIEVYEELWKKVNKGKTVAERVIDDPSFSHQQRHALISEIVLDLAEFCDEHSLYLNDEVTVHCCSLFMGVEDIQAEADPTKAKNLEEQFRTNYLATDNIIRSESGLKRIDKVFSTVTKVRYSSEIIDYYRKARRQRRDK